MSTKPTLTWHHRELTPQNTQETRDKTTGRTGTETRQGGTTPEDNKENKSTKILNTGPPAQGHDRTCLTGGLQKHVKLAYEAMYYKSYTNCTNRPSRLQFCWVISKYLSACSVHIYGHVCLQETNMVMLRLHAWSPESSGWGHGGKTSCLPTTMELRSLSQT